MAHQSRAKARKFFLLSHDTRAAPGVELENVPELIEKLNVIFFCAPDMDTRGFAQFTATPRFRFAKRDGPFPRDFEQYSSYWLVTDKAKACFEAVDPGGFAFKRCEFVNETGEQLDNFWLCDAIRIIDALNEAESDARPSYTSNPKGYNIAGSTRLVFRNDAVGGAHVFRMKYLVPQAICDDVFRAACKAAELKGLKFYDAIER